jgi:hypothetical protein
MGLKATTQLKIPDVLLAASDTEVPVVLDLLNFAAWKLCEGLLAIPHCRESGEITTWMISCADYCGRAV